MRERVFLKNTKLKLIFDGWIGAFGGLQWTENQTQSVIRLVELCEIDQPSEFVRQKRELAVIAFNKAMKQPFDIRWSPRGEGRKHTESSPKKETECIEHGDLTHTDLMDCHAPIQELDITNKTLIPPM